MRAIAIRAEDGRETEGGLLSSFRSEPSTIQEYLGFIDGLRCIAVFLVVLYHLKPSLLPGGFVGVDVFFVISGFLITGICVDIKFNYYSFYISRIKRIVPAYFVAIIIIFVVGIIFLLPNDMKKLSATAASSSFFSQNIYLWKTENYFTADQSNALLHTWSLAVECQFYLVFPLIVSRLKIERLYLIGTLFIIFSLSFAMSIWAAFYSPQAGFYLTPFRVWEFLIGSFVTLSPILAVRRLIDNAIATLGLLLILGSAVLFGSTTPFPGLAALAPCLGTAFVLCVGRKKLRPLIVGMISGRLTSLFGKASYSIYLVHWPIIAFANYFFIFGMPADVGVGAAVASVVLGILSWRYIELPFRIWKPEKSIQLAALAFAGAIAVLTVGSFGYVADGLPSRFSREINKLADGVSDTGRYRHCLGDYSVSEDGFCRVGLTDKSPTFVVWGDSFGDALLEGIDGEAIKESLSGIFIGTDACPPLVGFQGQFPPTVQRCREIQAKFRDIVGEGQIKTVIVAARWLRYERINDAFFKEKITETFSWLKTQDIETTVVGSIPGARANVPMSMAKAEAFGTSSDLGIEKGVRAEIDRLDDFLNVSAKGQGFNFVRPTDVLCPSDCLFAKGKELLYFDRNHLSPFGSRLLVDGITKTQGFKLSRPK